MNAKDYMVIEQNKTEVVLFIVGACAFIALGAWMLQLDSAEIEPLRRFNNPLLIHGIGIVSIAFSGLCGVFWVRKLFDKGTGLVLDSVGIQDKSSSFSV